MNGSLDALIQRVEDLKTIPVTDSGEISNASKSESKAAVAKRKIFSQKVFVERESLLTVKSGVDTGVRTLENIFIAFLVLLGIHICVENYFEN